ncbi:mitotic spindle assembly checkpoint protein MAD2A-like [Homarus americanus]|uniref:Mitotic spindle assembly checkpoint protein MAD2A n=1 Tax=Homarus americanus TaxID=6706 RepID=A0A8J5MXD8_HOMAM|nr:mitotic spindle assembly checkpoint protein MAD2A-like [Homarus americanus]KAG7166867.1 mitotic spindle assembly checkpoint protein MAD2A-like [Homarus americanus]
MEAVKQETCNNSITLKGSAQLVSEFFYYGINSILYQRGIYPPESFTLKQQYGLTLYTTTDKGVKDYLNNVLAQIKDWLEAGNVQRLVLVVTNVDTKEVLERWDFDIQHDPSYGPQSIKEGKVTGKDLKVIQKEMRDVIRQITACVTFLPLLDCVCAFDLLVYTHKNAEVPEKWSESAPCFISNSQEVRLKSFSTSIHKVEACVSYKIDQ